MPQIGEGVYWCARDLAGWAVIGNHHFILVVTSKGSFQSLPFTYKSENEVHFCTLGGFLDDDDRLVFHDNNKHDVKATREYIDPDEHTHLLLPDFDLEPHRIKPPLGTHRQFIQYVCRLADNYRRNTVNGAPKYSLLDENCAAWVNTLFAVAGLGQRDREEYGEFFGIDIGEEDLIDPTHFAN